MEVGLAFRETCPLSGSASNTHGLGMPKRYLSAGQKGRGSIAEFYGNFLRQVTG